MTLRGGVFELVLEYPDSGEMHNLVVLAFNSLSGGPKLRKIEP